MLKSLVKIWIFCAVSCLMTEQVQAEWNHNFVYYGHESTLSFFSEDEDNWVSQLRGSSGYGYAFQRFPSFFANGEGFGWDFSFNFLARVGVSQALTQEGQDQYSIHTRSVAVGSGYYVDQFEPFVRLYYSFYKGSELKATGPFVGFGYTWGRFDGDYFVTRGESVTDECRQVLIESDDEQVPLQCERFDVDERFSYPVYRIGWSFVAVTPVITYNMFFGYQPPIRFSLGDREARYEERFIFRMDI